MSIKRKRNKAKDDTRITTEEMALFCEEMTEKLLRIEAYVERMQDEVDQLREESVEMRQEMLILQQQVRALTQWQKVDARNVPVQSFRSDRLPVVVLKWNTGETSELEE